MFSPQRGHVSHKITEETRVISIPLSSNNKCDSIYLTISLRFNLQLRKVRVGVAQYRVILHSGRPGFDSRQRQRIFPLASVSRQALWPTQPPIQWVQGVLSRG
jgi:hypothetical protein